MAKQYNLFGEAVSLPTAKRPKIVVQVETYKSSWTNSAPWSRAPGVTIIDLPATWLLYVEDPPGMFCTLCTKYNKETRRGKSIWIKEPCTLFRLQSVH